MNGHSIGITIATIEGLNTLPYYAKSLRCWVWNLLFGERPPCFLNLCALYVGKNQKAAMETYYNFKNSFTNIFIFDGDKVVVIYDKDNIISIGKCGKDCWLDVRDEFKEKTFSELKLNICSLVVECDFEK